MFECGIFSMRLTVIHQCSSLSGPRFEGIMFSRKQLLDASDHSVVINKLNKKIIGFVINS